MNKYSERAEMLHLSIKAIEVKGYRRIVIKKTNVRRKVDGKIRWVTGHEEVEEKYWVISGPWDATMRYEETEVNSYTRSKIIRNHRVVRFAASLLGNNNIREDHWVFEDLNSKKGVAWMLEQIMFLPEHLEIPTEPVTEKHEALRIAESMVEPFRKSTTGNNWVFFAYEHIDSAFPTMFTARTKEEISSMREHQTARLGLEAMGTRDATFPKDSYHKSAASLMEVHTKLGLYGKTRTKLEDC